MKEEIVVELDRDGSAVRIDVKAGSGGRCVALTRFLEEALGPVTSRRMKADRYLNRNVLENRVTLKEP